MNTELPLVRSPETDRRLLSSPSTANLTFTDRLELRVGLWLLLRNARRQEAAADRDDHRRSAANARSRADR